MNDLIKPSAVLRLRPDDNVALALRPLVPGDNVLGTTVIEAVPVGHKVALEPIPEGSAVIKYSSVIAESTIAIAPGQHVHVHNARMPTAVHKAGRGKTTAGPSVTGVARTFSGIRRADGSVATRNFIGILTTVNCSGTVARAIADRFRGDALAQWPGVDGVVALTHPHGCAMGRDSDGIRLLRRTLAGYANHPNFAGVLMVGLGCESNEMSELLALVGGESQRIQALEIQSSGGTSQTINAGIGKVQAFLDEARNVRREPLPVSHLTLGLQCGGSDAFSGITANPALGVAADLLVANGGTAILSETPEIYGAEHLLLARAETDAVAEALRHRISWWTTYAARHGGTLNDNPSAGNIAGGITTILEKSLGAVAKGGGSPLRAVYEYAEPIREHGFVFMDSPGFDPVSATGQVAAGANLIAFTTGRGSTFGCKPVPSLKLATNTRLYENMREDMDINCGDLLDDGVSMEAKGREIFEALIETASGVQTASERLNYGEAEFVPWIPSPVT
ncbi:altronate dehydratase [Novosphingobium flavum]|uniref:Altronate dehydratase n=1 Tax=Novosphingobium flavum TaxID=1778672 RepID=A0A7X1KMK7_9SPHN|nr:altronate dehydratase family protein [Novosphingobium flavum]MBC2666734.1 altronate dehydratase [Novosphingobium flavum]